MNIAAEEHIEQTLKGQKRILIVDDEQSILDILTQFLTSKNFLVTQALSSTEAYALLEHEVFSMVLLDWKLNGRGGGEHLAMGVLRKCRELYPNLPITVISGERCIDVASDAIRNGADAFIAKPFSLDVLDSHINMWIDRMDVISNQLYPHNEKDILPLEEVQRRYVLRAVELLGNNISRAAEKLKIHRHTASSIIATKQLPDSQGPVDGIREVGEEERHA